MYIAWHNDAWDDYLYWQMQDKKTLKRINTILKDIIRNPLSFKRYRTQGNVKANTQNYAGKNRGARGAPAQSKKYQSGNSA